MGIGSASGGRAAKKSNGAAQGVMFEEERNWLTLQELAYLCHVEEVTTHNWVRQGVVVVIAGLKPTAVTEEEARRVYTIKGGSPEGGWRSWPRLPKHRPRKRT